MEDAYNRTLLSLLNYPGGRNWWDPEPDTTDLNIEVNTIEDDRHSPVLQEEPIVPPETPIPVDSTDLPDAETPPRFSEVEDMDDFVMTVDVKGFKYAEVRVHVDGMFVVIHAKQRDGRGEPGFVPKDLTRKLKIPEYADAEKVKSFDFCRGVVTITCPRKKKV